jgi:signal transduction histidine kinase
MKLILDENFNIKFIQDSDKALLEVENFKNLFSKITERIKEVSHKVRETSFFLQGYCIDFSVFSGDREKLYFLSIALNNKEINEKYAILGKHLSSVIHDLKTPLSSIIAYSECVLDELNSNEEAYSDVSQILSAAVSYKKIIESLLSFSRNQIEEKEEEIGIEKFLNELEIFYRIILKKKQISFERLNSLQDETLFCSRTDLSRILYNIIGNAIEGVSSSKAKKISIKSSLHDSRVVIAVTDTGVGIDDIDSAFEEHYSSHNDLESNFGLGMSIIKRLCQKWDIKLEYEKNIPCGTVAKLSFPRK